MGNRVIIDNLVMLFSTDWFFEFIPLVFPRISNEAKDAIQSASRIAVRDFMGKIDVYWNISFSDERIRKTVSLFFCGRMRPTAIKY